LQPKHFFGGVEGLLDNYRYVVFSNVDTAGGTGDANGVNASVGSG